MKAHFWKVPARRPTTPCLTLISLMLAAASGPAAPTLWLEGEKPASATFEYQTGGWGNRGYLSGESWLHFSIPDTEVERRIPAEGGVLRYAFTVAEPGDYEVWNRAGFEYVRSPFAWRVDDGPWSTIDPQKDLSTDLMEIARWCEIAWVPMGKAKLDRGTHTLELRFTVRKDAQGRAQRLIYTSDALVLSRGIFRPNGSHKPGAEWRTDRDRAAERHVFTLPEAPPGTRSEVDLHGDWQYARFDEAGPVGDARAGPVTALPARDTLHWSSLAVPGDRNALRPDQAFCHRYVLRTRVHVPASLKGRRLLLDGAEANLMISVLVNGRFVGFSDAVASGFTFDVSDAVQYGAENELAVVVKDAYYALEPNEEKPDSHFWFNIPLDLMRDNQGVTMRMDYPTRNTLGNGLLDRVRLLAAGPAVIEDVYFRPSVQDGCITVETTVHSPVQNGAYEVAHEILDTPKTLAGGTLNLAAAQRDTATATTRWPEAVLWWPDQPHLYTARTLLTRNGRIVDSKTTRFGFRTWSIDGTRFALNGIPWQFRADLVGNDGGNPAAAVARWRETGQNMFRLRFQRAWGGMTRRELLEFFDTNGVPVRCNAGTFDGQHASYGLVVRQGGHNQARVRLFDNWRKQVEATVLRERNHPCVFVWELDNEIIYINTRNFGNLDVVEPQFKQTAALVASLDRQGRGQMVAGGRALMDGSLPINGCHYEASADRDYPDMAYGLGQWTDTSGHQPWPMATNKPVFLSEEAYLHGRKPQDFAGVGGERCFAGRSETKQAGGLLLRMYSEGYRWQELGGFHYWCSGYDPNLYSAWQPVCALVREWTRTLPSGRPVARTVMVRNDTRRHDPITLQWALDVGGNRAGQGAQLLAIPPGRGTPLTLTLPVPAVTDRADATLELVCLRHGQPVWSERKAMTVLNPDARRRRPAASGIALWEHGDRLATRLRNTGMPFRTVTGVESLPADVNVLIVGPGVVTPRLSTDPCWRTLADGGKRIVVLEQHHPLHYQAVPADLEPTDFTGRMAFIQDPTHPVFDGLQPDDFLFWPDGHVVYRHIYRKATRGARSLLHADDQLGYCALAECAVGEGLLLLCQAVVGTHLDANPVAARLFDGLVDRALDYRRERKSTVVCLPEADPRFALLEASGLVFTAQPDPLAALRGRRADIVVADATPARLAALAGAADAVNGLAARGGTLMLWGVTPDGLKDFNRLVGVDHLLRPFTREKVQLPVPRPALAAGLSQSDVALSSGKRIAGWQSIEWAADDTFTHVVDLEDIVPFLKGPGIEPDPNGGSIANGFTDAEFWRYICYFSVGADGKGPVLEYELPRPEDFVGLSIVPNSHYKKVRQLVLTPNRNPDAAATLDLEPYTRENNPRQEFSLDLKSVRTFTLAFTRWDDHPQPTIGIDNLWIKVRRPVHFRATVQPIVDNGGLVFYPKTRILLNQLRVPARESVPAHREQKQTVVATLLRNLNAVFAGGETLDPATAMRTEPVSLEGKCNLYLSAAKGWPLGKLDLSHAPLGEQRLGGVRYAIRDFKTSPLESAITLQGLPGLKAPREVTGIAVGRRADALFFLHTWNRRSEWHPRRTSDQPPVLFQYVIRYEDGSTHTADVRHGLGADHYAQPQPKGLKEAALAWAAPFEANPNLEATLYAMSWKNPHPGKTVVSIDVRYAPNVGSRYGTPIVLGISTGTRLSQAPAGKNSAATN
ncbi:MAG: hypothetical protein JXQ71_18060 [Verrucomicrobia bacterium]|nr:hypothetical protein [Verrucomicrobiota bacterium]